MTFVRWVQFHSRSILFVALSGTALPRHRILGPQPLEHLVMLQALEAIEIEKVDTWRHGSLHRERPPASDKV